MPLTSSTVDWVDYYQDEDKEALLNVISLEFSKSELDPQVITPAMVRLPCLASALEPIACIHVFCLLACTISLAVVPGPHPGLG